MVITPLVVEREVEAHDPVLRASVGLDKCNPIGYD